MSTYYNERIPLGNMTSEDPAFKAGLISYMQMKRVQKKSTREEIPSFRMPENIEEAFGQLGLDDNENLYSRLQNDAFTDTYEAHKITKGEDELSGGQWKATIDRSNIGPIVITPDTYANYIRQSLNLPFYTLNSEADAIFHLHGYKDSVVEASIIEMMNSWDLSDRRSTKPVNSLQYRLMRYASAILNGDFYKENRNEILPEIFHKLELAKDPSERHPLVTAARHVKNADAKFRERIEKIQTDLPSLLYNKRLFLQRAANHKFQALDYEDVIISNINDEENAIDPRTTETCALGREQNLEDLETTRTKLFEYLDYVQSKGVINEHDKEKILEQFYIITDCESLGISKLFDTILSSNNNNEDAIIRLVAENDDLYNAPNRMEYLGLLGISNGIYTSARIFAEQQKINLTPISEVENLAEQP